MQYFGFGKRTSQTPQSEPIPGREVEMAENHAGAFSFVVDDITQFKRFIILGGMGTYYIGTRELIKENLGTLERLLRAGRGKEAVDLIVEISTGGRAPSNDPALFALARCCACDVHDKVVQAVPEEKIYKLHKEHHPSLFDRIADGETVVVQKKSGPKKTFVRDRDTITLTYTRVTGSVQVDHPDDIEVRRYAFLALPKVARTGTHFLHFQAYVKQFRGRGRALQQATRAWYQEKPLERVAYQVLKYQNRDGWRHRDILRLSHPNPIQVPGNSPAFSPRNALYKWITKGWEDYDKLVPGEEGLALISAYERVKSSQEAREVARLIKEYHLPREAIPTEFLRHSAIWEALIEDMPLEALTRNLATMTRHGVLEELGTFTRSVVIRLHDKEAITRARLHPIKILAALKTYESGRGVRGSHTWTPLREIVDALNDAFYLSFEGVAPISKSVLIAIDTSYSMHGTQVNGIVGLNCHTAAAALSMVIAKSAWKQTISGVSVPTFATMAFDTGPHRLTISPEQRLDDIVRTMESVGGGGTDCSIPLQMALANHLHVDAFLILTDSESWFGKAHPAQLLQQYRKEINPDARLINIQMAATKVTNNDPNDFLSLDVAGFDTAIPGIVHDFIEGEI